jgi:hypothetical protein
MICTFLKKKKETLLQLTVQFLWKEIQESASFFWSCCFACHSRTVEFYFNPSLSIWVASSWNLVSVANEHKLLSLCPNHVVRFPCINDIPGPCLKWPSVWSKTHKQMNLWIFMSPFVHAIHYNSLFLSSNISKHNFRLLRNITLPTYIQFQGGIQVSAPKSWRHLLFDSFLRLASTHTKCRVLYLSSFMLSIRRTVPST